MKANIGKFVGYYEQVKALEKSWQTYEDIIVDALELFERNVRIFLIHINIFGYSKITHD